MATSPELYQGIPTYYINLIEKGQEDLGQAMLVEADLLKKEGQMSSEGTKKLRYGTRKLR